MRITLDLQGFDQIDDELYREILRYQSDLATEFKRQVIPRTPIDKGRARAGWKQRTNVTQQIVENQVPYIERLEKGYSKQAPRGFVKQAITAAIDVQNRKRIIK